MRCALMNTSLSLKLEKRRWPENGLAFPSENTLPYSSLAAKMGEEKIGVSSPAARLKQLLHHSTASSALMCRARVLNRPEMSPTNSERNLTTSSTQTAARMTERMMPSGPISLKK